MKSRVLFLLCCIVFVLFPNRPGGLAVTLAEKREQLGAAVESLADRADLKSIHEALSDKKKELKALYEEMQDELFSSQEDFSLHPDLKNIVNGYKQKIVSLQKEVRKLEAEWKQLSEEDDEYEGLWHQPDTTIGQLVIDYGSDDAVYVMPPEIAALKIHLNSRLSVPKSSWGEMLEVILSNFGIGIKTLTPFVKQLYFIRLNQTGLDCITDDRMAVEILAPDKKIAFVCAPQTGEVRRVQQFLEKFAHQDLVSVQVVGGHLVVVGFVRDVKDLLKIYDFIAAPKRAQDYRIITLQRASSEEIAKVLASIFEGDGINVVDSSQGGEGKPSVSSDVSFGFRVMALKEPASSLFLMGKTEQIEKACEIVKELETSIGAIKEKGIHWYACRHSEAEELAKVLSQVYKKMTNSTSEESSPQIKKGQRPSLLELQKEKIEARTRAEDALIVQSEPIQVSRVHNTNDVEVSEHFIVDAKTNSIIMVVENYLLPKLKELLRKLDVPKRMVQIDVLLFEKKVTDSSSMGLSKLKMGDAASDKAKTQLKWADPIAGTKKKNGASGIVDFFLSQGKTGWFPAYDLAYQFLLSQEDVQINANPSITTVNQTPAQIAVVDQMSINTGVVEINREHVKDAYSRAEYGITIKITPTVHAKIDEDGVEEPKYVTLSTDIIFDSTRPSDQDRPDVTRRNIKNEVRIRDGETVILGGLRRKLSSGQQKMIPFLGELPGIGKFFSMSSLADSSTEMFVFLTPRILPDAHEEWQSVRIKELSKRPGDTPEFLQEVYNARENKKTKMMEKSLRMLLGKPSIGL